MRFRTLALPLSLSLLVACDRIQELVDAGEEPKVHVNDAAEDDDPPPPPPPDVDAEPELVTETRSLQTTVTVQKGQRSKMMAIGTEALEEMAKKRGYTGVRKVRLSRINCTTDCSAKISGTAWRKVEKKPD